MTKDTLTPETVQKIAHLARIATNATEAERTLIDLNNILALFAQLDTIDTDGVEPMAHSQPLNQRLRPDRVTETDQRQALQQPAPETEAGLYLVPKVIEEE